jgi:hypothetical protein
VSGEFNERRTIMDLETQKYLDEKFDRVYDLIDQQGKDFRKNCSDRHKPLDKHLLEAEIAEENQEKQGVQTERRLNMGYLALYIVLGIITLLGFAAIARQNGTIEALKQQVSAQTK